MNAFIIRVRGESIGVEIQTQSSMAAAFVSWPTSYGAETSAHSRTARRGAAYEVTRMGHAWPAHWQPVWDLFAALPAQ